MKYWGSETFQIFSFLKVQLQDDELAQLVYFTTIYIFILSSAKFFIFKISKLKFKMVIWINKLLMFLASLVEIEVRKWLVYVIMHSLFERSAWVVQTEIIQYQVLCSVAAVCKFFVFCLILKQTSQSRVLLQHQEVGRV